MKKNKDIVIKKAPIAVSKEWRSVSEIAEDAARFMFTRRKVAAAIALAVAGGIYGLYQSCSCKAAFNENMEALDASIRIDSRTEVDGFLFRLADRDFIVMQKDSYTLNLDFGDQTILQDYEGELNDRIIHFDDLDDLEGQNSIFLARQAGCQIAEELRSIDVNDYMSDEKMTEEQNGKIQARYQQGMVYADAIDKNICKFER